MLRSRILQCKTVKLQWLLYLSITEAVSSTDASSDIHVCNKRKHNKFYQDSSDIIHLFVSHSAKYIILTVKYVSSWRRRSLPVMISFVFTKSKCFTRPYQNLRTTLYHFRVSMETHLAVSHKRLAPAIEKIGEEHYSLNIFLQRYSTFNYHSRVSQRRQPAF